ERAFTPLARGVAINYSPYNGVNNAKGRRPVPHWWTSLSAFSVLVALSIAAPAAAQTPAWAPTDLRSAAKAEGGAMTVYGSMNEQEALPYYKLFEDATGIKVTYVRAS